MSRPRGIERRKRYAAAVQALLTEAGWKKLRANVYFATLDRNGKDNTKDSEAVAEFHTKKELDALVTDIFKETDPEQKARLIDQLYKINEKQKNSLTGPSGNTINAFLAAYDPASNISVISRRNRTTD